MEKNSVILTLLKLAKKNVPTITGTRHHAIVRVSLRNGKERSHEIVHLTNIDKSFDLETCN